MLVQPDLHRIRKVDGLAAEMDPGQAVFAFEVLDHVVAVSSTADLWDTKETNEFLFGHDGGTRIESTILGWEDGW